MASEVHRLKELVGNGSVQQAYREMKAITVHAIQSQFGISKLEKKPIGVNRVAFIHLLQVIGYKRNSVASAQEIEKTCDIVYKGSNEMRLSLIQATQILSILIMYQSFFSQLKNKSTEVARPVEIFRVLIHAFYNDLPPKFLLKEHQLSKKQTITRLEWAAMIIPEVLVDIDHVEDHNPNMKTHSLALDTEQNKIIDRAIQKHRSIPVPSKLTVVDIIKPLNPSIQHAIHLRILFQKKATKFFERHACVRIKLHNSMRTKQNIHCSRLILMVKEVFNMTWWENREIIARWGRYIWNDKELVNEFNWMTKLLHLASFEVAVIAFRSSYDSGTQSFNSHDILLQLLQIHLWGCHPSNYLLDELASLLYDGPQNQNGLSRTGWLDLLEKAPNLMTDYTVSQQFFEIFSSVSADAPVVSHFARNTAKLIIQEAMAKHVSFTVNLS